METTQHTTLPGALTLAQWENLVRNEYPDATIGLDTTGECPAGSYLAVETPDMLHTLTDDTMVYAVWETPGHGGAWVDLPSGTQLCWEATA